MKKTLLITTIFAFALSFSSSYSQEVIPSSGGNAEGSGGSVSFSVGQLFFMTHTGENGSLAEGVQQPYEISVVTAVAQAEGIELLVSAFPNPATDHLILRVEKHDFENLEYRFYDTGGRLLKEGNITGSETAISMKDIVPAIYFLKVIQTSPSYREVKTFRIIKN